MRLNARSLGVVVPSEEGRKRLASIKPGSAIVAIEVDMAARTTLIYYEGFVFGQHADAEPEERFLKALQIAAGRAVESYPTIARMSVPADALTTVGVYDYTTDVLDVTNPDALQQYLSASPSPRSAP